MTTTTNWVVGVDGCPAGWVIVFRDVSGGEPPEVGLAVHFSEILAHPRAPSRIAVDMPIGLPDRTGPNGRAPERSVRPLLGARQSSVFSIPARAVVYATEYREACRIALETSDPPRKVAKQAFYLFPKMREIDQLMTPQMAERVFEVHPEAAFWRLNGGREMSQPKKVKSRPNPAGLEERIALLGRFGFERDFLTQKVGRGVGPDDLIDACVNSLIAERLYCGKADPHPDPFERDSKGLPVAIWF